MVTPNYFSQNMPKMGSYCCCSYFEHAPKKLIMTAMVQIVYKVTLCNNMQTTMASFLSLSAIKSVRTL